MDELTTFEENNEIKPKPLKPELSTPLNPWIRGIYSSQFQILFLLAPPIPSSAGKAPPPQKKICASRKMTSLSNCAFGYYTFFLMR